MYRTVAGGGGDDAEVIYLEVEDVLGLYGEIFGLTREQAADQLRNEDGLAGALARPKAHAHYEAVDLAVQAAVLAHGIAEGQHFIEGNKRTALAALRTFLLINGFDLSASQEDRAGWILSLSTGMTVEELGGRLRECLLEDRRPRDV